MHLLTEMCQRINEHILNQYLSHNDLSSMPLMTNEYPLPWHLQRSRGHRPGGQLSFLETAFLPKMPVSCFCALNQGEDQVSYPATQQTPDFEISYHYVCSTKDAQFQIDPYLLFPTYASVRAAAWGELCSTPISTYPLRGMRVRPVRVTSSPPTPGSFMTSSTAVVLPIHIIKVSL